LYGTKRQLPFDAVIGIGGTSEEPVKAGISGKLNWIGSGRREGPIAADGGPLLTFDHFILFEQEGLHFAAIAPKLAARMFGKNPPRSVLTDFDEVELQEIDRILKMAEDAPASSGTPCVPSNEPIMVSSLVRAWAEKCSTFQSNESSAASIPVLENH
jgi:hypothetical protein